AVPPRRSNCGSGGLHATLKSRQNGSFTRIQHFAHFAKQVRWRKGLLDKGDTRLDHVVMNNGIVGVTGGIEHTCVGTTLEQGLRGTTSAARSEHDTKILNVVPCARSL